MEHDQARDLSARYGDSFYILDVDQLAANVAVWRAAFRSEYPNTAVYYPYKANNLPAVCQVMADLGLGAEVCSPMEWELTQVVGPAAGRVRYGGSGRPAESLTDAMVAGATIVIDSVRDARLAATTAAAHAHRPFDVELRIPLPGMPGTRLGVMPHTPHWVDVLTQISGTRNLRLVGLQCHVPGGDPAQFAQRVKAMTTAASGLFRERAPRFLDVGGGFYGGVPARWPGPGPEPQPVDYARAVAAQLRAEYGTGDDGPTLVIEPGTALVATAVSYVTRVMDVKPGPRGPVAVVAGSLLHTSPNMRRHDFPVRLLSGSGGEEQFDIAGHTPMPDEWLALAVPGRPREGDFVRFADIGAYSLSMAPAFMQPPPAVIGHSAAKGYWLMAPQGTPEQVFQARGWTGISGAAGTRR